MPSLFTIEIRYEQDVVQARQRTRAIAEQLGFDTQDQTRLATAVSEIARNAFQYAQGGTVEFHVETEPPLFLIRIHDQGPGIPHLADVLEGRYTSQTGMGIGITGTRRLMDTFEIEAQPGQGTTVVIGKALSKRALSLTSQQLQAVRSTVLERSPQNLYEEIQRQNQELLRAMADLRKREEELTKLNRELEDTNRGVVALYAELDEKAESLQKANELKTRFLSNMSHEFRTPLNSVLSLSRMLLERMDGDLTVEQETQVTLIQKATEGLAALVNDLLDLAKVEAGKTQVHPSAFEVSDLFGALRGMLRPLLVHDSPVTLIFQTPDAMPTLYTDEGKVAQILRNFIANALKFTDRGEVRVTATQTSSWVRFSVVDTGIGIAPDDQERIFEDFIQIESHLQANANGTGLGLPLSRKLAELLGGSVSMSSELGKGAVFSATIPIAYIDRTEPQSSSAWQLEPTRCPILVVEDNAETLLIYEQHFQSSKYQCFAVRTLEQAQQALQQLRPAAIILDIVLERQNGWTLLRDLKGDDTTCTIPVLVITVVDNEKQALALGADGFLVKPVDRLSFLNKLNTLINQGQSQAILVVDDESTCRYVVKQLLADTDNSLRVLEAASGREGLEMASLEQPAAIVLDLVMPGLSGFEVLDQLKRNVATQTIPVIIHTSMQLDAEAKSRLAGQSIAILSKATIAQATAIAQLQEALIQAGLVLNA